MSMPSEIQTLLQSDFVKLLLALLFTVPIAYNREQYTKIMGLRTFPLVAIASCSYVLIAQTFLDPSAQDAQARIMQGLMAGIGFIGGGAILKKDDRVLGTASAASIWTTGALGAAVAYGRFDIGIFLAIINFIILRWFTPLKDKLGMDDDETTGRA